MRLGRFAMLLVGAVTLLCGAAARAQETVHFPSLDDERSLLDGYLFRAGGEGRHPAVVFLHGCSGMFTRGQISPREREWAARLNALGDTVLMVDSFGPRHHGEMCSVGGFELALYRNRPKDAYGALAWLQAQPEVLPDRIGAIGWSQGGGVVLLGLGAPSLGRPSGLAQPDFRAAVAFYPASCNVGRLPAGWTINLPLLVLIGDADVWTPAAPCQTLVAATVARGAPIEMQVYPGAYHGFDAPNLAQRELPDYRTRAGVVPIVGTDPAARADALQRVPAFLAKYLAP
jgi:dienelactone hydrolase